MEKTAQREKPETQLHPKRQRSSERKMDASEKNRENGEGFRQKRVKQRNLETTRANCPKQQSLDTDLGSHMEKGLRPNRYGGKIERVPYKTFLPWSG